MTSKELVAEMRARWTSAVVRTHFEDCWRIHRDCAIERLCREVEALDIRPKHQIDTAHGCHASESVE